MTSNSDLNGQVVALVEAWQLGEILAIGSAYHDEYTSPVKVAATTQSLATVAFDSPTRPGAHLVSLHFWADLTSVKAVNGTVTVENAGMRGARLRGHREFTRTDDDVVSAVAGLWARECDRILVERVAWLQPFAKLPDELTWLTLDLKRQLRTRERVIDAEPGTNVSKDGPARRDQSSGFLTLLNDGLALTHAFSAITWWTRWADAADVRVKRGLATANVVVRMKAGEEFTFNVNRAFAKRIVNGPVSSPKP